jgi:hypothetical protein
MKKKLPYLQAYTPSKNHLKNCFSPQMDRHTACDTKPGVQVIPCCSDRVYSLLAKWPTKETTEKQKHAP